MIVVLVFLGVMFFLKFFGFIIWPALEFDDTIPQPTFVLNENGCRYSIYKDENGAYMIRYISTKDGSFVKQSAFIGSSKVDLSQFMNREVMIKGKYRKKFGEPLCWDTNLCWKNSVDKLKTVVDIDNLWLN